MFIYKIHRPSLLACNAWKSEKGRGLTRLRPQEHQERRGEAWVELEGHTSPPPINPLLGKGWRGRAPSQGHDRASSLFMCSFLQGLQASICFCDVGCLVVRAVLCESRRGFGTCEGPEATGSSGIQEYHPSIWGM